MDRRLVGALLVVAVFAVAIVVPLLGGRRTTGLAEPAPVPRDPRMGDCLLHLPEGIAPSNQPAVADPAGTTSTPPTVSRPLGPAIVPCGTSPAVAEVVLTLGARGDLATRQRRVAETGIDCRAAALRYAGLTRSAEGFRPASLSPEEAAKDVVAWRMSINVRTAWVYPSQFLRSAGRIWAACVVAPPSEGTYRGSLADAFGTGRLPNNYGICWDSAVLSAAFQAVSCDQPHLSELLSVGVIADRSAVSTAELRASCQRLAIAVVGRRDPTDGGRLTLKTTPETIYPSEQNPSVSVSCYLTTAGRPLSGTLMGLHEAPVPFGG